MSSFLCSTRLVLRDALAMLLLAAGFNSLAHAQLPEERLNRRAQTALRMDAHPVQGEQVYIQYCSGCHGDRAFGDPKKDVPALAGQRFAYLVRQLANFAAGERESTSMHSVVTQQAINDPQHWVDIAAYVNHLEPSPQKQTGNGEAAALGSGIFHEQCATCHGADATGDRAGWVPSLRQQNYGYLDKQMHKLAAGYRHNIDENLVLFMHSLDERDMEGTADYLSRLKGPGKVRSVVRPDGIAVN